MFFFCGLATCFFGCLDLVQKVIVFFGVPQSGSKCDWFGVWHQLSFPHNGFGKCFFFKAATSALSSRLNAKALPTGCYGEHTYKGELTKITSLAKVNSLNKVSLLKLVNYFSKVKLFTHTNPFYKLEHAYKGDLTYTCELADKGEPTFTSELNLKGDHTYKGDFA